MQVSSKDKISNMSYEHRVLGSIGEEEPGMGVTH